MSEKGQTLIELIVVIVMVVLVVTALTIATITSLRNSNFAKNQAQATKIAQEGIERVRIGRNQNKLINHGTGVLDDVIRWNGDNSGTGSIWNYQCGAETTGNCQFRVNNGGVLTYLADLNGTDSETNPFKRYVILSDDAASYGVQKKVTVVVKWKDVSGDHESRLTTVLRKI